MTRRKPDTSKKRETLLDAAARVFADKGYDGASMDRVAQVANASKRTVYNHFPSKEVLFNAVIERFLRQSYALKLVRYDLEESLEAQLGRFADAILELGRNPEWLGLIRVMTGAIVIQPALVAETMAKIGDEEDTLETWLIAATAGGRLRVSDPHLTSRTFWAALTGAFLMPAIYGTPLPEAEAGARKRELIQMLLARCGAPASVASGAESASVVTSS